MSKENRLYRWLANMSTYEISTLCKEYRIEDFTGQTLESVQPILKNILREYQNDSSGDTVVAQISRKLTNTPDGRDGVVEFFQEYLEEVIWVGSQLATTNGAKTGFVTQMIYQNVHNKKVLAKPTPIYQLVEELHQEGSLKGIRGLIVRNNIPRNTDHGDYLDVLEEEIKRLHFYREKAEGKALLNRPLMSKEQYIHFSKIYGGDNPTTEREENVDMMYIAYLFHAVGRNNTLVLGEKTKAFFGVLREVDLGLSKTIQTNKLFHKTRIYEEDGYTLILRGRFVLIDNIRNKVIINKTPTDIAKKDLEMMVKLLTSK